MTNTKWSTPTLKARWFDDESIENLEPVVDVDAATRNTIKAGAVDVAVDSVTVQAVFDRFPRPSDEPASG